MRGVFFIAAAWCTALGYAHAEYVVQLGAFADTENAALFSQRVRAEGFTVISDGFRPSSPHLMGRVLVGPYATSVRAKLAAEKLTEYGWEGFVRLYEDPSAARLGVEEVFVERSTPSGIDNQAPGITRDPSARGEEPTMGLPEALADLPLSAHGTPFTGGSTQAKETVDPDQSYALFSLGDQGTPTSETESVRFTGYFQNEGAYTYPAPDHFSKFRNTFNLDANGRINERMKWKASGRVVYDAIYDLDEFYPTDVRDDQRLEAEIRETFLDIAGNWDLRIGRQHIVWGEVVGAFVADVVSARDLRDFRATDLDQVRIPQWAIRAEHFGDEFYGEMIWIPYMTYDDLGEPGAEFYPLQVRGSASNIRVRNDSEPRGLSNSAFGARVSHLVSGWDASLFYYTSMDRLPAFERQPISGLPATITLRPIHERIHQLGTTLTKGWGDAVFRAEAVYTKDRLFSVSDLSDADGLVEKDQLEYVLSVEFAYPEETRLNLQLIQRWVPEHDSAMPLDELESSASFLMSTRAAHPHVEPQLFFFHSLNRSEWLLRSQILWEMDRNWQVVAGLDVFSGSDNGGLIGQFDDKDRVFYELRYVF